MGNGTPLTYPNRIFWDFSYTKCPVEPVQLNTDTVKMVTFGQKSTSCRMVFHLTDSYKSISKQNSPVSTSITFTKVKLNQPKQIKKTGLKPYTGRSLKGKTIIIDPGHGGSDPGAVTNNNDYEKHYTLDISRRIQKELIKKGANVILLRTKDTNPSLYQRVKKINRSKGDFLISVHVNSFINGLANGTETYYYKKSERLAAKYIQKHLNQELNLRNNGIKHARMYVLKYSNIPGVLIEPCFMTNKKEYALLKTTAFRNKIAKGTVLGLEEYYKKQ